MAGSMRYRVRITDPDSETTKTFAAAMTRIQSIQDNRGYDFISGLHGAPFWYCWHHQFSRRSDNRAQLFLPWHRAYLYYLELAVNDFQEESDIGLLWWDWTRDSDIPAAYSVVNIDGTANPLRRFRMNLDLQSGPINRFTRRNENRSPFAQLPDGDSVDEALADSDWSSFSDLTEDLHDIVHGWVGGDMGDVTTAGYDPIFFAHHCMIDRLWYLWQIENGINSIPSDLLDVVLDPFAVTVGDVLDTRALGYEYADEVVPIEPVEPTPVG